MNIPNLLTTFRFLLAPVFIRVFFSSSPNSLRNSIIIFIIAGITDVLDGYIARKYNVITKWGQAMDPLADKVMQLTVIICFTVKKLIPLWVIIIYGAKELSMILGGIILYTKKEKIVLPANSYGKIATVIFYMAIIAIAFDLAFGKALMFIAALFTLYAFVIYAIIALKEMSKLKNPNLKKPVDKSC